MTFIHDAKLGGVTMMARGRKHRIEGRQSRSGGHGHEGRNNGGGVQARANRGNFLEENLQTLKNIYLVASGQE